MSKPCKFASTMRLLEVPLCLRIGRRLFAAFGLSAKAAKAAKAVRKDMALDAADCILLGQPKSIALPDPTMARVPGALVNLLYEGTVQEFLLVAHIDGDRWFCHCDGAPEDPFNANCFAPRTRNVAPCTDVSRIPDVSISGPTLSSTLIFGHTSSSML